MNTTSTINIFRTSVRATILSAALLGLAGLGACSRSSTDIQLRDAADQSPLVGESLGRRGPAHMAYIWTITDTDGVAHFRSKRNWTELEFVVAGPGRRIEATASLHPGTGQWVALTPAPDATRRIEARIVGGEGAPPAPKDPSQP